MATKLKKKEETKAEERVPNRCYACLKYDGTFGPKEEEYTHVCEECRKLPTDTRPIEKHVEEYKEGTYGEGLLSCEHCGLERDECQCPNNPLREQTTQFTATLRFDPINNGAITPEALRRTARQIRTATLRDRR